MVDEEVETCCHASEVAECREKVRDSDGMGSGGGGEAGLMDGGKGSVDVSGL